MSLLNCCGNTTKLTKKHAEILKDPNFWDGLKSININKDNSIKIEFRSLNNPFYFDDNNSMALKLNNDIVYIGRYTSNIELYLPKEYINVRILPVLLIKRGDDIISFASKQDIYILDNDVGLYSIYCPDNEDRANSWYLLPQRIYIR